MFVTLRHSSTSKSTLFPNLHSRSVDQIDSSSLNTDPGPVNPAIKPAQGGSFKRRADAEESRSSSHLSKRRKYSTEPSKTFNIIPADPTASLRLLDDFKLPGLFLHPDVIATAERRSKPLSSSGPGRTSSMAHPNSTIKSYEKQKLFQKNHHTKPLHLTLSSPQHLTPVSLPPPLPLPATQCNP